MADEKLLYEAARNGDTMKLKAQINFGAAVSYFNGEALTPLMHAACSGGEEPSRSRRAVERPQSFNLSAGDFAMNCGSLRPPPQCWDTS